VGLERGPLSLVSTIEELLGRNSSGFGLENRDYGRKLSAALTRQAPLCPQKLALTSTTSGGRSVGMFFCFCLRFMLRRLYSVSHSTESCMSQCVLDDSEQYVSL
jgi:hypothetical protein